MHQSATYASQTSKSIFVEMSERSAETARLLQEAREAQPAQLSNQGPTLARQAASQWARLLQHIGKRIAQREAEAAS